MKREAEVAALAAVLDTVLPRWFATSSTLTNASAARALHAAGVRVIGPDLTCPKCGVNSHDNNGADWTHTCDQRVLAALGALPDRYSVVGPDSLDADPK